MDELYQNLVRLSPKEQVPFRCIEKIAFSFADLLVVIAYAALVAGMVYAGMKGVF